jgi:hypothetical protein
MSTHDMDLLNASGSAFRQDLNLALKALASNSSNAGDPTTLYDNQFYADTGDGIFKIRNAANSGFIDLFKLANNTNTYLLYDGSTSGPSLCFRDDTNTGIFSRVDDEFNITTGGTERFRITGDGFTKATNTGTVHGTTSFHESLSTNNNQHCHVFSHHGSTQLEQLGILVRTLNDPGGTQTLIKCDTGSTVRFVVRKNGVVANQSGAFSQISDVKLKENIVDANSQWNDIKAVKVRNYNFKKEPNIKMLGVVAQEIETVSAGLVTDVPDLDPNTNEDLGTVTKEVKQSILYMKALKALQEAMARIETLEAKVATLEGS